MYNDDKREQEVIRLQEKIDEIYDTFGDEPDMPPSIREELDELRLELDRLCFQPLKRIKNPINQKTSSSVCVRREK